jgi:hypothetical protein
MKRPTLRRLYWYTARCLRLHRYLESPGDGRQSPDIPARSLLWALLAGRLLRESSYHAIEALVRSPARRALGVGRRFSDDALGYFTERLDPAVTRDALITALRQAKRNKAFDNSRWIGLAVDGTTVGRRSSTTPTCSLCRPRTDQEKKVHCYLHHFAMISVVGTGLSLPFDVEPYGSGDSEYSATLRLLRRSVGNLGMRFADYVVADGEFARAPFVHAAGDLGLNVVVRLKGNLPELLAAAQKRFAGQPPDWVFFHDGDRIELWDADDLDPWETLRWKTVRVLRYRQHKPNGNVIEALWFTDFPKRLLGSRFLFFIAKSRWEIENQGFNDAKNRYGLEHICHHEPRSLLIDWLLTILALTIERLYRLRYLHRGTHPLRTAIELLRLLRLGLSRPMAFDSS